MKNSSITVPVASPAGMLKSRGSEIEQAIMKVVSSSNYILGNEVEQFEHEFAQYLGIKHCASVANGTDALALALKSVGVSTGDEVITVSNAAVATAAAIRQIGETPKLIDVNRISRCLDPEQLAATINKNTRAISPVHLYGQPADMHAIMSIANKTKTPLFQLPAHLF